MPGHAPRYVVHATCAHAGINTGVMLVRNTDFSRHLMDLTLHFGQFPVNMSTEQARTGASQAQCICRPGHDQER